MQSGMAGMTGMSADVSGVVGGGGAVASAYRGQIYGMINPGLGGPGGGYSSSAPGGVYNVYNTASLAPRVYPSTQVDILKRQLATNFTVHTLTTLQLHCS